MAKRTQPTWLHEAQGEATRKQILDAAQTISTSILTARQRLVGIVAHAGGHPGIFYRHFRGKLDVASALFDTEKPRLEMAWDSISSVEDQSVAGFARWIDELIAVARDQVRLST